jgi:hypothetical protein
LPQPNLRPTPKIRHFTYTFKGPRPVRPLGQKLQRNITGRGAGNSSAQEALGRRDTVVVVMLRRGRSRRRRGRNDTRHLALPLPSICVSSARRYSSPRCEWTTLEGRRSRPRLLQQDPATDRAGPPAAGDDGNRKLASVGCFPLACFVPVVTTSRLRLPLLSNFSCATGKRGERTGLTI